MVSYTYLKQNKKGISLVELMVTLAIAGIIAGILGLFVSQGTVFFRKQSTIVDLTNESQIISGQLEQSLMEANALIVEKRIDTTYIYTGVPDNSKEHWENPTGVERTIIITDGKIYISADFCDDVSLVDESNLISEYIKSFNIAVSENSIEYETDEAGTAVGKKYVNPVVVNVKYTLAWNKSTKDAEMTIKLRNYISHCEEN